MSATARFKELAGEERFRGWPLVGEAELGYKIPFFGQVLAYKLRTGNGVEEYYSLLRHFGWSVCFGVTTEGQVITLVQWKPGINQASWELPPGGIGKIEENTSRKTILKKTQEVYLNETGYGNGAWQYLGYVMIETGKYRGATPDSHGFRAHMWLA